MRRRTLLGGDSIDYVFSAQSTSVYVSSSSSSTNVNIKSTANGSNIGYSVLNYDGIVVTRVTTAATYVTINYSENPVYGQRNGFLQLQQNGSNKKISIIVLQLEKELTLDYACILFDGTSESYGSIIVDSEVSFRGVPSWANVEYHYGHIYVNSSSDNSASTARLATITVIGGSQSTELTIIQLPSDYHSRSYVSMGGVNWSIKNVGASSVQDYGNYYQWGAGAVTYEKVDQYHTGGTDSSYTLPSDFDTATQVMKNGWRMPTLTEMQALASVSYYWVRYKDVNGGVFESNGEVLFFPAAGYFYGSSTIYKDSRGLYWSSTPSNSIRARTIGVYDGNRHVSGDFRYYGFSVRGVHA